MAKCKFILTLLLLSAHLNHLLELYFERNRTFIQALMVVGMSSHALTALSQSSWGVITFQLKFYNTPCPHECKICQLLFQHISPRILTYYVLTGLQLGYTVIFGSYASFLFIRTGLQLRLQLSSLMGFCPEAVLLILFST